MMMIYVLSVVWDEAAVSRFSWLSYDVTSYEHYDDETTYENSLVYQGATLQLSSLFHVCHSLTHNARQIFLLLVRHQLASNDNSTYIGTASFLLGFIFFQRRYHLFSLSLMNSIFFS